MNVTEDQMQEMRLLLDEAIEAKTKKEAESSLMRLRGISNSLAGRIDSYAHEKLDSAIICAKEASGRSKDKERWTHNSYQDWYLFKNNVNTFSAGGEPL